MIKQPWQLRKRLSSLQAIFLIAATGALATSGCTKLAEFHDGLSTLSNPAFVTDTTVYTHEVKNISIATLPTSGGNSTPEMEMSVSVNTGLAGFTPLTGYCGSGGTNPCKCQLVWTEVNTIGGGSSSFTRKKLADTSQVQSGLVKCKMSQAFWNEIASGTAVRVTIVPAAGNGSLLSVKALGYKKGTTTSANGDFLDDTLTPFRNIHRYTCYSKRNSAYEVLNQFSTSNDSNGSNPVTVLLASRFCTGVAGGSGQCATPRNGYSAQSYYRNLYIRSDKMGEINSTNNYYDCPKVVESIRYSANSSIPSAEKGKYWPLDTTFALATEYSSEWSVGVRSGTILYKQGDANSVSDACMNEDTNKRLNEKGIIIKCLGYAKVPKPGGSCGQITDSNGRVRPMVRLRRYRVVYPGTFQSNGQVDAGGTEADEVYVADRLVVNPAGVPTGAMIYGPKPCNFSWFDHEGVVNRNSRDDFFSNLQRSDANLVPNTYARPAYVGTNNYFRNEGAGVSWSVNPDGLVFPKIDRDGAFTNLERPFCSAALPRVEDNLGTPAQLRLTTSHQDRVDTLKLGTRSIYMKEVHLKPVDPWTPNYVEDTTFQACVPVADPYLEPPLHFYRKNANEIAWCAKSYPTQNPYWLDLNSRKKPLASTISAIAVNYQAAAMATYTDGGEVVPRIAPVLGYTSHNNSGLAAVDHALDDKNASCVGTKAADICLMSLGSTTHADYPGCVTYLSTARTSCDRTVTFDANQAYRGFPLQARDAEITSMLTQDLNTDHSYSCQYSVHPDSSKIGTQTPISGCCGIISGTPLLNGLGNGQSGHLEPYLNTAVPNIRFCGNPVEVP